MKLSSEIGNRWRRLKLQAAYGNAIDLYARDNISDGGKPKLSIVLIDRRSVERN